MAIFAMVTCAHAEQPVRDIRARRAGICYLTAGVRSRPNLKDSHRASPSRASTSRVRRIVGVDGASGLMARPDGLLRRETLLTAGALRTPAFLMRSGIGPAQHLRNAWISPVVADRPGVGENLQNHAVMYVCALLNPRGREPPGSRPAAATYLRWSSRNARIAAPRIWPSIYAVICPGMRLAGGSPRSHPHCKNPLRGRRYTLEHDGPEWRLEHRVQPIVG